MSITFTEREKDFIHYAVRHDMKKLLSARLYGSCRATGKDWPEDWEREFDSKLKDIASMSPEQIADLKDGKNYIKLWNEIERKLNQPTK